jgi:hypothetical protein
VTGDSVRATSPALVAQVGNWPTISSGLFHNVTEPPGGPFTRRRKPECTSPDMQPRTSIRYPISAYYRHAFFYLVLTVLVMSMNTILSFGVCDVQQ